MVAPHGIFPGWLSRPRRQCGLRRDRRSTIAILAAFMVIPLVGCIGLAIDFTMWNQAHAALAVAANAAAMNAAKIAGNSKIAGNQNYVADGVTAGMHWFAAALGTNSVVAGLNSATPTVTVVEPAGTALTAKVTVNATVTSIFGVIFDVMQYPLTLEVDATVSFAPYLDIQVLIDSSSSMLIGATDADVVNIALAVMCSTKAGGDDPYNNKSFYSGYACSYNGYSYDGTCPVQTPGPSAYPFTTIQPLASWQLNWWTGGGPSCKYYPGATANSDGSWPTAGPPCGFACHSDGSGAGNDPYGVVRASPLNIELRLDAVKNAVKSLISNMTSENFGTLNNLRIGIWDFNFSLNQDYPTDGTAAGSDWTAAANAVGGTTTGIQPHVTTGSTPDTDFDNAMTNLASQLGNAGNGKSTDTARKALFLLTDGVSSSPESGLASGPFSTNYCTTMKQKGYTIYVVYTPYYSLPHTAYFGLAAPLTQPLTNSQVTTALQACASTPSDFIAATDDASLTAALKTFLRAELANPVGFTK